MEVCAEILAEPWISESAHHWGRDGWSRSSSVCALTCYSHSYTPIGCPPELPPHNEGRRGLCRKYSITTMATIGIDYKTGIHDYVSSLPIMVVSKQAARTRRQQWPSICQSMGGSKKAAARMDWGRTGVWFQIPSPLWNCPPGGSMGRISFDWRESHWVGGNCTGQKTKMVGDLCTTRCTSTSECAVEELGQMVGHEPISIWILWRDAGLGVQILWANSWSSHPVHGQRPSSRTNATLDAPRDIGLQNPRPIPKATSLPSSLWTTTWTTSSSSTLRRPTGIFHEAAEHLSMVESLGAIHATPPKLRNCHAQTSQALMAATREHDQHPTCDIAAGQHALLSRHWEQDHLLWDLHQVESIQIHSAKCKEIAGRPCMVSWSTRRSTSTTEENYCTLCTALMAMRPHWANQTDDAP